MPLILAIEPNRAQAQQIALLLKQHVPGAELVAAPTADAALAEIGTRVPDLVLTPALLAPRDEHALTGRLRELGTAAAHVHTLAVPIIAAARSRVREYGGGLLGRRKDKAEADDVGCDPALFAEQIRVYLERAARERQNADESVEVAASEPAPPDAGDEGEFEIVWLPDGPPDLPSPSTEEAIEIPVPLDAPLGPPEPPIAAAAVEAPRNEQPASPPREEKRNRDDSAATRAFEAEFGLPPSASGSPPLWRVTEEGMEALTATEPPPSVVDEPSPAPHAAATVSTPVVVAERPAARPAKPTAKPSKAKKPAPPIEDWAYFDPQQSAFKALIRRLDEIAGYAAR